MYFFNVSFFKYLLDQHFLLARSFYAIAITLYIFTMTQETIYDKRTASFGLSMDQVHILRVTEHLFYLHCFLMFLVYTNNSIFAGSNFLCYNSLNFAIINILFIFFSLVIINLCNYHTLIMGSIRSHMIRLSYILIICFMFCKHLLMFFILLEIYSLIFFIFLIGFKFNIQEFYYYLQQDLISYVFIGLISTLFFLIGFFFIIKDFGINSLNFTVLRFLFENSLDLNLITFDYIGILFILLSLFIKLGLAPFQGWTFRFLKRTCFQSIVFLLLVSKLILIFGAFFSLLPIFIKITPVLRFIGLFGFISYFIGSYSILLRHPEADKLLGFINLTSSGFFFTIFFVNNPHNYNFAFVYFCSFMVLLSFILITFFSTITTFISKFSKYFTTKKQFRNFQKNFTIIQGAFFETYNKLIVAGELNLNRHELHRLFIISVLASLPPTITFYCKVFFDFSFFNSAFDITTPYSFFLIVGMLTYILTILGYIAMWRKIYVRQGLNLTVVLFKKMVRSTLVRKSTKTFSDYMGRYTYSIFFIVGFFFGNFNIL